MRGSEYRTAHNAPSAGLKPDRHWNYASMPEEISAKMLLNESHIQRIRFESYYLSTSIHQACGKQTEESYVCSNFIKKCARNASARRGPSDRKSTRLNSSHSQISYAVFCLKQ